MSHAYKECVSGFGYTSSLWFHFIANEMVGYTIETPTGVETLTPDAWFEQHLLIFKVHSRSTQKSTDVLPYLSCAAGLRAVQAVRDYNAYELAIAFTSHYAWQLINGAKILQSFGELAKVYAGTCAVYLFKSQADREAAILKINNAPT